MTAKYVADHLRSLGIEKQKKQSWNKKVVGIRADMATALMVASLTPSGCNARLWSRHSRCDIELLKEIQEDLKGTVFYFSNQLPSR